MQDVLSIPPKVLSFSLSAIQIEWNAFVGSRHGFVNVGQFREEWNVYENRGNRLTEIAFSRMTNKYTFLLVWVNGLAELFKSNKCWAKLSQVFDLSVYWDGVYYNYDDSKAKGDRRSGSTRLFTLMLTFLIYFGALDKDSLHPFTEHQIEDYLFHYMKPPLLCLQEQLGHNAKSQKTQNRGPLWQVDSELSNLCRGTSDVDKNNTIEIEVCRWALSLQDANYHATQRAHCQRYYSLDSKSVDTWISIAPRIPVLVGIQLTGSFNSK